MSLFSGKICAHCEAILPTDGRDALKAERREIIRRFGHAYGGIISVLRVLPMPAEGEQSGGRPAVFGACAYGVFTQGERVRIIGDGHETETTVLKLIPCTAACPFREEMSAGTHKTECFENDNVWLILDCALEDIAVGDKIAVCPIRRQ